MMRLCYCPLCGTNAAGERDWTSEEWVRYSRPGNMVVCTLPECTALLVFQPGPSLRPPDGWELFRLYASRDWQMYRRRRNQLRALAEGT